jgi:hypothetical protein
LIVQLDRDASDIAAAVAKRVEYLTTIA